MRTLKNREAIVEKLAEMLKKFDMQLNEYQTDVYLYYNEEEQTAELDTLSMQAATRGSMMTTTPSIQYCEHHETDFDFFDNLGDLADAVGIQKEETDPKSC